MKYQKTLLALVILACVAGSAEASLTDRGNGLLYDDALNVTWLQDANYANTSGYASATGGLMDWNTAKTWAADLVYEGYSDWRLASNSPVSGGPGYNFAFSVNGTTDYGYNISSLNSELAYMYHVNLGLKDYADAAGNIQTNYGIFGNGTNNGVNNDSFGQADVSLVKNLQSYLYWSGAEYSPGTGPGWFFNTHFGNQDCCYGEGVQLYAWAVHPGDIAAVPLPAAFWLFGTGLISLLGFKRRKIA